MVVFMTKLDFHKIKPIGHEEQQNIEMKSVGVKVQGRNWTQPGASSGTSKLERCINSLKTIQKEVFHDINNQVLEKNYKQFSNFRSDLKEVNAEAHKHNNKWYVKLLSFLKVANLKVDTLDNEIADVNKKMADLDRIQNVTTLINKLNDRVKKYPIKEGSDGLFRESGAADKVTRLEKEFLANPEMDLKEFSDNDIATAVKTILRNMPDEMVARMAKINDAKTPEDASEAWAALPENEQKLCKDFIGLLKNTYEINWKPKNRALEGLITSIGFVSNRVANPKAPFPNAEFLLLKYDQIFERKSNLNVDFLNYIYQGDIEKCKELIQKGVSMEAVAGKEPPFMVAVFCASRPGEDRFAMCQLLLDHGADINGRNDKGQLPLERAIYSYDPELVEWLIGKGAKIDLSPSESDKKTLLEVAEKLESVQTDLEQKNRIIHAIKQNLT